VWVFVFCIVRQVFSRNCSEKAKQQLTMLVLGFKLTVRKEVKILSICVGHYASEFSADLDQLPCSVSLL
jgi:hypothetical protein